MTKEKIIIGLPVTDANSMKATTAHSIGCMIMTSSDLFIDFLLRTSCDIVSSRTWLVNEAIRKGGTHILFVDYDMVFPENAARQLLSHGKEIVGVEYNKRKLPLECVYSPIEERTAESSKELYKANYAGMGLMLIDLSIFKKFTGPFFNFGRDSQGALALGEDVWFCNSARDAGFETYIDPTIEVGHLGEYKF